jgi:hypothetical protein
VEDFGSIFSTLLPGASCKLCPPDGMTVLDGLEVKVAFGDVWKESLTELSGGQRSLTALCNNSAVWTFEFLLICFTEKFTLLQVIGCIIIDSVSLAF